MNRLFFALLLLCALVATATAQVTETTVCDILKSPQSFDGKTVKLKGTVIAGFDEFAIKDASCGQKINAIWLAYPEGTKAKAGPVASLQLQLAKNSPGSVQAVNRPPVKLDKNKDFKQLDSALSAPAKGSGMCLGCVRNTVTATLVGRLDAVTSPTLKRENGKFTGLSGFGNLNAYSTRLVLQSVSDVVPQEIDYSKNAAATKGDNSAEGGGGGDPVAGTRAAAKSFPAGSAAAQQLERAAAAYGGPGEDNGVIVGFGSANEVRSDEASKGSSASPDGLLLICTFDMDRLKGDALGRAMSHVGSHIADLRATTPLGGISEYETAAWHVTVFSAVGSRQKTLTLPGGYLVWNAAWAPADRGKSADEAIGKYLSEWAAILP